MSKKPNVRFTIRGNFIREAPSGKAFLLQFVDEDGDELEKKWIPYSQARMENGDFISTCEYKEELTCTIPLWLAEAEGMDKLMRDEVLNKEYGEDDPDDVFDNDPAF